MSDYMTCLKSARGATERCRHLSKQYLECRMSKCVLGWLREPVSCLLALSACPRGLMAEEDLAKLGFKQVRVCDCASSRECASDGRAQGEASAAATQPVDRGAPTERRQEEKKGFVAGLRPLQGQLGASAQHRQR